MRCSACESDNPPGQRFCGQCGTSLLGACPSCGATNSPGQRFCGDCGSPLAGATRPVTAAVAPAAARTERRVCSVLFCDLVGFTPLSESRDAEEVRELLSSYFDATRTVIARYGGVVEKFIGDAVMAVWGTPVAVEGDAERAVRAAMDVVAAVAQLGSEVGAHGLAARAGVVTGEVAVNLDAVGEGMVAGDPVNTAARVQAAAEPGQVLVDESTQRLARSAIAFATTGEHLLKGKSEPAELWAAQRVVGNVGGDQRVDGLESALVGRATELRLIKELFHASVDRRSPRLVSITGQAGVGKSRLGWEFEKYVDGLADGVLWHRGRCLTYGSGVAFWALAQMVRQRFGIAEEDSADVAAQRLAELLPEFVPQPAHRDFVAPRLGRLIGIAGADAGELNQADLFAGWRLFFEQLAEREPVVMLVEDLHRADDGLLAFLSHLIDWARNSPIFILTFARSELAEQHPSWGSGRGTTTLVLEPLDDIAMTAMLDNLVPDLPADAAAAIAEQAEGVPLYAIETVRMLVDRDVIRPVEGVYRLVGDVGQLRVPESLQSLLSARLDSLPADSRTLVADAAVLGSTFPAEALVELSGRPDREVRLALDDLVRREVFTVRGDPLSPERGHFGFVQALLRQVAYDTLSRRERKARHLAVADRLTGAFSGGGEEIAEVVAGHLVDALEAVPSDPDVPELRARAADFLTRAADRAARTGAPLSAAGSFLRAAGVLEASGGTDAELAAAQLYERAGDQLRVGGDLAGSRDRYRYAEALYRRHGLERRAVVASVGALRSFHPRQLRPAEVAAIQTELGAAMQALAAEPDADTVNAISSFANNELFLGHTSAAEELYRKALALAQGLDLDDRVLAELLMSDGMAMLFDGRIVEGTALQREALRRAQGAGDALVAGRAAANLCDLLMNADPSDAVDVARTALRLLRQVGARDMLGVVYSNLISALFLTPDWDAADAALAEAEADDAIDSFTHLNVMSMALARGDNAEARARFAVAEPMLTASADFQDEAAVLAGRTMAAFVRGDYAACAAHSLEAAESGARIGVGCEAVRWSWPVGVAAAVASRDLAAVDALIAWLVGKPKGHITPVLRVELALARAARADAAGECDPSLHTAAIDQARAIGFTYAVARGRAAQAECLANRGESERAAEAAVEARGLATRLRLAPLLDRIDA